MTTEASCCIRIDETSQVPGPHVPALRASLTYATAAAPVLSKEPTGTERQAGTKPSKQLSLDPPGRQ